MAKAMQFIFLAKVEGEQQPLKIQKIMPTHELDGSWVKLPKLLGRGTWAQILGDMIEIILVIK